MLAKKRSVFNIRPQYDDNPYTCYRTTTEFVKRYVDQAVRSALKIITNMNPLLPDHTRMMGYFGNKWPTCGSCNARNGASSINAEMKSWNALPAMRDWMFHTNFIGLQCKGTTEFYMYQVMWSVPTAVYPEPQVTVSVFFYIASSKIYPSSYPVDVTYGFEGNQFLHNLNIIFRPKWLYDTLDMKTMMFKTFNF